MMRCVLTSSVAVLALYVLFLGGMSLITPMVQRALNGKEHKS